MVRKVAVIGGGVMGVTSAVVIAEGVHDVEVTLISDKWSPDTTGDGSAGFWAPYLLGDVPGDVLRDWCKTSFQIFQDIYMSPHAAEYGVGLLSTYYLSVEPLEKPVYSDLFLKWQEISEKELSVFPIRYRYGASATTFFVECTKLLPVLMKRLRKKGGKFLEKKVKSITELAGVYDVVINCSGLGARDLVPDPEVKPVRGQVIRVQAPWVKQGAIGEDGFYILPNSDEIILGGTHQEDDWNLEPDPEDRRTIWEGCTEIMPCLKEAKIVRDWVGLRPFRPTPRVERETIRTEKGKLEVIHNYGHGGSGVTLSWGCAHHVLRLLLESSGILSHL